MSNAQERGMREFDLYLSEGESHVCENSIPWTEGCNWAKPDIHVVEVDPSAPDFKKLAEDLAGALSDALNGANREECFKVLSAYRAAVGK